MIIYKFGGTSVGKPERMHAIANLIQADPSSKIVVLSALSGTTNSLVAIGDQLIANNKDAADLLIKSLKNHYAEFIDALYKTDAKKDEASTIIEKYFKEIEALALIPDFNHGNNKTLVAYGEILSTNLFTLYLQELEVKATLLDALDFMRLNEEGEPDMESISANLKPLTAGGGTYITQGFICRNHTGQTDNLKRGGSDYSASLIGAAIDADEVQIWTDIDGMHNNDPRVVDNTRPIAHLTFDEAAELAYFGAKILHPSSILPAQTKSIPVKLKNTMAPEAEGTTISIEGTEGDIKAIAAKDGITAIKIKSTRMLLAHGFLRRVFEVFEKYKTSIDMITTSEVAVSVTIDNDQNLSQIRKELEQFGTVAIDRNQTIVCIVGSMVSEKKGLVKLIFNALSDVPVRMVSYGGSRNNISLLISSEDKTKALVNLHEGLFK
ncbi:aspartate kinase [Fulvivirga sp. RKSG066]|uniref:aspartate kinase n=1 Tax=Fulvivirga aurantia TaxID=2529383 RepID=UPI0012BC9E10|nr:aspartate kinase [Fulvivirga aurantia]MTI22805.1 aspartate kinase [Fulvivirga aurantia]